MRSINLKKKIVFTKKAIALGLSFAIATAGVNFISDTVHAAVSDINTDDAWVNGNADTAANTYHITLKEAGKLTVTAQSYADSICFYIYNCDESSRINSLELSGSSVDPKTGTMSSDLEAGDYIIKAIKSRNANITFDYRIKTSFEAAGNNETEPNNSFDTSMPISIEKQTTGFLSVTDKLDFYNITLSKDSYLHINVDSNVYLYKITVYDKDWQNIYESNYKKKGTNSFEITDKMLSAGTYFIKFESTETGVYKFKCSTPKFISAINLKKSNVSITLGKSYSLLKSVTPDDADKSKIIWTSDNENVVKVSSNGILKAVGCGNATITAKSTDDTSITVTANITVKAKKAKFAVCKKKNDRWVKVRAKSQNGVSSFQYQMSKTSNFKPGRTSSYIDNTNSDVYTARLSAKKTYYFRTRAIYYANGKKCYGPWSNTVKIKTGTKGNTSWNCIWKNPK